MEIIEFNDIYIDEVKKLLKELQEYIVSLDSYHFNIINDDYEEKIYSKDLEFVKKNKGKIYLAKENDKVVGLIMGIIREPESDFDYCRPNKLGEVIELIVTKNIRSKGIGKTLLDKMEEYFKDNECKTINIDVFGYNDIGKSFYKKEHFHDRLITMSKEI